MIPAWFFGYLLISALALVHVFLFAMQTWENRRFARRRRSKIPQLKNLGRVAVLAPCKGTDVGLEENLRPLFEQDYSDYELVFVVESDSDPSSTTIRRLIEQYPRTDAQLIVAGPAKDSGQKVHNLRVATRSIAPEVKILAFVDSDARPPKSWLANLIQRLDRPEIGAKTGYRWFIPQRRSLANYVLYSLNGTIAALFGPGGHHLVWGGSWAIRRETFDQLGIREAWRGTLSDDLLASRVLHGAALRVEFEPACVVGSPLNNSLQEMFEFVRRQYIMGRFYAPRWWGSALILSTIANLGLWGGLAMLGYALATQAAWTQVAASFCAGIWILGLTRAWLRQDMSRIFLPQSGAQLRTSRWFDLVAGPIVGLVNWFGLASSLFGNRVTWRGIRYRIFRGGQVEIIDRESPAAQTIQFREAQLARRAKSPTAASVPRRRAG